MKLTLDQINKIPDVQAREKLKELIKRSEVRNESKKNSIQK